MDCGIFLLALLIDLITNIIVVIIKKDLMACSNLKNESMSEGLSLFNPPVHQR